MPPRAKPSAPSPQPPAAKTARQRATTAPAAAKAAKPAKPATSGDTAKPRSAAKAERPGKPREDKPRKPKLVRDSFTIPKDEYGVIDALKQRTAKAGSPAKKSELLRAGLKLLAGLDDADLLAATRQVPALKTGRPGKA